MTKLDDLAKLGQSVWLDFISRSIIDSGELQKWVDAGLRGMTSNPTIFEKAISGSHDYDAAFKALTETGKNEEQIYTELVTTDIRQAADILLPVYERSGGLDGMVSLEVDPTLAHDTQATLTQALDLWRRVDRPNLMVKIPATLEGLPAIREAITAGLNINVTLIFSLARYQAVMAAYLEGLEKRYAAGMDLDGISSVASFFVSRVDSKVDSRLEKIAKAEGASASLAQSLMGQAAVNNARLAYQLFREVFESPRFRKLQENGARLQRPLWASTSTKNPAYSDILYVQELIGAHTVNTMPMSTIQAFLDHGEVRLSIENALPEARSYFDQLSNLGIRMEDVTRELEIEGVDSFAKSYLNLLAVIHEKSKLIHPEPG